MLRSLVIVRYFLPVVFCKFVSLMAFSFCRRGLYDNPATVEEAKKRFAKFIAGDEQALVPDLRDAVYKIALAHGDAATFDSLLQVRTLNRVLLLCFGC